MTDMMKDMTCPSCNTVNKIYKDLSGGVCTNCHKTVGTMPTAENIQAMAAQQQQQVQVNVVEAEKIQKEASKVSPFANIPVLNKIKFPDSKIGRAALVVVVVGGGYVGLKLKNKYMPKKGTATYSSLSIDMDKADPDKFISSLNRSATRWRSDAKWWAITVPGVRPDGTVNLHEGTPPVVTFISPSRVSASSKGGRKNSIKKFRFGKDRVDYRKKWGAMDKWKNVRTPELPTCTIKNLVSTLGELGFSGDQRVDVRFDPVFDRGRYAWHVLSEQKDLEGNYSMEDCARL